MDKQSIRIEMRRKRRSISVDDRRQCSANLLIQLQSQPWYQRAESIGAYLDADGEISPTPTIEHASSLKKRIYLPKVSEVKGEMQLCLWQPGEPLKINRYGISEPRSNEVLPPSGHSMIFLPLVAFDSKGTRIGMGGGYYDRLLAKLLESPNCPLVVGMAYDFQKMETIDREEWDIPMDAVVTDKQVIRISARSRAPIEPIEDLT